MVSTVDVRDGETNVVSPEGFEWCNEVDVFRCQAGGQHTGEWPLDVGSMARLLLEFGCFSFMFGYTIWDVCGFWFGNLLCFSVVYLSD